MDRESCSGFVSGLAFGLVIGAAIGFLYAPQPGAETRRLMKEKASEIKEKTVEAASKIKESVIPLVKRKD